MPAIESIDTKLRARARREVEQAVQLWMNACPAYPKLYHYADSPFYNDLGKNAYGKADWRSVVEEFQKRVVALIVGQAQQQAVDKFLEDFDKLKDQLADLEAVVEDLPRD